MHSYSPPPIGVHLPPSRSQFDFIQEGYSHPLSTKSAASNSKGMENSFMSRCNRILEQHFLRKTNKTQNRLAVNRFIHNQHPSCTASHPRTATKRLQLHRPASTTHHPTIFHPTWGPKFRDHSRIQYLLQPTHYHQIL